MTSVVFAVPAMYADHHVVEVRRILHDVPGVRAVYASSAFRVVEIDFDDEHTSPDALERLLDEAGYLSELPVLTESGEPATDGATADVRYRRYTTSNASSGSGVAFRQESKAAAPPRTQPTEMEEG